MRILLIGSGGREHALAWKLAQSPRLERLFVAPGNGGTAGLGPKVENVAVSDSDVAGLVAFAKANAIDLVAPGPEAPLVAGVADAMAEAGIACFGPSAYASQLEGSKAFAKEIMAEAKVPTAAFMVFDDADLAKEHARSYDGPLVVKADGLAAGKGVVVCENADEAVEAIDRIMVQRVFGSAGDTVVVEEALVGEEASFLAFCDGHTVVAMPSSQDHKAIGEGDTGPNTGGMGAYSPAPVLSEAGCVHMLGEVIAPITRTLAERGHPFVGVLYAGLMLTAEGPKVLEYNVRFGDPECQPLMMRLDADLVEIMAACARGRLVETKVAWRDETALCVVMAAEGYPESYPKGMAIDGIAEAEALGEVKVFQAGTALEDGRVVSTGGRVLGVTALGGGLAGAKSLAYEAVDKVRFDQSYCRRDIGDKGLAREG
jgi:phosphoribosylamine--glycine ligase